MAKLAISPISSISPCKFLLKLTDLTELTCKNLYGKVDQLDHLEAELCQLCQVGHAKKLHENSYPLERLFYKFSCISQKNVVSLHAKLRAKAKKEQAGYEYEDKDR